AVAGSTTLRAIVPVSVRSGEGDFGRGDGAAIGGNMSAHLVDLPVGEANPVVRLHHITHAMRAHSDSGRSVAADALVKASGFAPPTLHALGARVASQLSERLFNLLVINVPGP